MTNTGELKVALAQIAPVWLNKKKTTEKIKKSIIDEWYLQHLDSKFDSIIDKLKEDQKG